MLATKQINSLDSTEYDCRTDQSLRIDVREKVYYLNSVQDSLEEILDGYIFLLRNLLLQ